MKLACLIINCDERPVYCATHFERETRSWTLSELREMLKDSPYYSSSAHNSVKLCLDWLEEDGVVQ